MVVGIMIIMDASKQEGDKRGNEQQQTENGKELANGGSGILVY